MALWGSLFPLIKIGYVAFDINPSDIPSILFFAATRFLFSGIVICVAALVRGEKIKSGDKRALGSILLIGLFSIVLHYAFLYIGISSTDSAKTAVIKQLGSLIYVCTAFLFLNSETFSRLKIIGGIIGFLGIIVINFDGTAVSFSVGDLLIIGASACTVVSSIISKRVLDSASPVVVTGISQLAGGAVLFLISASLGTISLTVTPISVFVFLYISLSSIIAYLLWNYILSRCELSNMLIFKFSESLFACIFGAVLLGENIFKWQYLAAFILIFTGIFLGNKSPKTQGKDN